MEQAMSMLLTGGAVGPESFRFYNPGVPAPGAEPPPESVVMITEVSAVSIASSADAQEPGESGARPFQSELLDSDRPMREINIPVERR